MRASYSAYIVVCQEGFILGLTILDLAWVHIGWVLRGLSEVGSMEKGITREFWLVFGLLLSWTDRESFYSKGTTEEDGKC